MVIIIINSKSKWLNILKSMLDYQILKKNKLKDAVKNNTGTTLRISFENV